MERRELRTKLETKPRNSFSTESTPPSVSPDLNFLVSFGMVISCRLGDVAKIRTQVQASRGRVVFQTVSNGNLFLFRQAQVEKALAGDVTALMEIHKKKERRMKP